MKEYKLIKSYPGSPELGTKVNYSEVHQIYNYNGGNFYSELPKHQVENLPEFWEEVKLNTYVVLTYINSGKTIKTIQRLSDNVIFTLNDKIGADVFKSNKIERFDIHDNNIYVITSSGTTPLHLIYHAKTPILITEDNVSLYEGDSYWFMWTGSSCARGQKSMTPYYVQQWITVMNCTPSNEAKYFSTKQAAEDYIAKNKVLFVTEDSVGIKDGDYYFVPQVKSLTKELLGNYLEFQANRGSSPNCVVFSTKEKAQEYIDNNKPMYSKQQIFNAWETLKWFTPLKDEIIREMSK